jgi:hypothetical protein
VNDVFLPFVNFRVCKLAQYSASRIRIIFRQVFADRRAKLDPTGSYLSNPLPQIITALCGEFPL